MDAVAATGEGKWVNVKDYKHIILMVGTASSANLTAKVVGSILKETPDSTASQSVANHYDFLEVIDLEDGAAIDGDTGFVAAGTDDFRLFEINVNAIEWINVRVTARSAGSITVKGRGYSE